ncbi:MAG: hypothetical protein GY866_22620 [Proteobacteria bacterium]|nr:hypothetical protein [Pseudomonadota bacterium]
MRVTELTKHNAVHKNLNQTSEELQELLIGVSNGKTLNKPSDDPVGAAKTQDFHTSINRSKTLEKNISADKVWLNSNEETVKQMTDTLMHVKDLALDGANGAATMEHRSSLASEIDLITKDLVDLGNKREGKIYFFSGTKTFTKPLEIQPRVVDSEIDFFGTRMKSEPKIIPLEQDQSDFISEYSESLFSLNIPLDIPLDVMNSGAGSFTIVLNKSEELQAAEQTTEKEKTEESETDIEEPTPEEDELESDRIVVDLTGDESIKEIVEKINKAAIEQLDYELDPHSPTGYKANVFAEIGVNNAVYLDPAAGINLTLSPEDDTTGFVELMNFEVVGGPSESDTDSTDLANLGLDPAIYEADFDGYSKEEYRVRIIKGGNYGVAQYIVSDDGGKTWSKTRLLQQQNEIFNPEGKASNKVRLQFGATGTPYFKEGLQFQFGGNEFIEYKGNEQIKEVLIDNGIKVALNINAKQIFFEEPGDEGKVNIFDMMNRLKESLEEDDQLAVMKSVNDIDKAIEQVLRLRGQIGSTFKELESSEDRIESSIDFKTEELSKLVDMDLAKGAIDLNNSELKHKVALDSAARLIQPTLINFLK